MAKTLDVLRKLYFNTTRSTVQKALDKAIDLFKTLKTDEDREKAAVFMDGLSQMRSEWGVRPGKTPTRLPKKSSQS